VILSGNRALFLDRDGVINHDSGYTSTVESFLFIDGIFDVCREARRMGYLLIVVTNQAGIGRGYYSEQDFSNLTKWMCEQFEAKSAPISDVFYCPFHPKYGVGNFKKNSFDRKPNPGMLLRAAEKYGLDLSRSIMIGDKDSDMQAAKNAGIGVRCHYLPSVDCGVASKSATHQVSTLRDSISLLTEVVGSMNKGTY
jgi:D-glycero-D-manno-heptose 1,7-bisphosphate phosphatase